MIAFLFAWALKKAVMEPIAIASLMQVYFATIAGQTPRPGMGGSGWRNAQENSARWDARPRNG